MAEYFFLYIDPGSGSFLAQIIIAAIAGGIFYLRSIFFRASAIADGTKNIFLKILRRGELPVLLIPAFFILNKTAAFLILLNPGEILFYSGAIAGCGILLYYLLLLLIRNSSKAAIIASLFIFLFLYYISLYKLVLPAFPRPGLAILSFFMLAAFIAWKTKHDLRWGSTCLSVIFLCLVAFEGWNACSNWMSYSPSEKYINGQTIETPVRTAALPPDIYYIVFDSYTSSSSLKEHFGHNNTEIENFLKEKGFFIAGRAENRYNATHKSISSVLNMNYEPDLDSVFQDEVFSTAVYRNNIQHAGVIKHLAAQGYSFVNLSFFDLGKESSLYDFSWFPFVTNLGKLLFRETRLADLYDNSRDFNYVSELEIFDRLQKIPDQPEKKKLFVYAHLMTPHGPWFFDRNEKLYANGKGPYPGDEKKNYAESVMYSNVQIKKIVSKIISSGKPSVIIIQGDHGSRMFQHAKNDREQYSIFSAYYFPDGDYKMLNDSLSPVNSYRIVFNKYMDSQYRVLH